MTATERRPHPFPTIERDDVLAVICARGGSKGLPGKNIVALAGTPLVGHTIAQAARMFTNVVISTDDEDIRRVGLRYGATHAVRRPPELATDEAPKVPAIRHCVREVEATEGRSFAIVVDLEPTCPLRADDDIAGALALFEAAQSPENVVSVTPSRKNPYFNQVEKGPTGLVRLVGGGPFRPPLRRQDAPDVFDINGAVYVWRRDALDDGDDVVRPSTAIYVMPAERSVDIDGPLDLLLAEIILGGGIP